MNEHKSKVEQLDYQLFNIACLLSASAALSMALLDIFVTGHSISLFLDLTGFIIFSVFYYYSRNETIYPKLILPFIVILYLLINLSWFIQGGGFHFSDSIIFFLVFVVAILIIPKKYRIYLIIFTSVNVVSLVIVENINNDLRYQYPDLATEIFISDIFIILLFAIGGFMVVNFKNKYEILSQKLINAHDQAKESNVDLENTVQKRTTELKTAYRELDRLFYRSSHDFRRPLTTLMGIYEVARLMNLRKNTSELFMLMNKTVNSMDNMLKKFYNLYEISHYLEEITPVSLLEIVETYENDLMKNGHLLKKVVNLKKYNDKDPRNRLVDIIFSNMIENAVKYTDEKYADISLRITEKNNFINIMLEDKGIGIEELYYDRIFEMYFRTNERAQGNGLGLYVVKRAVDKLHGNIKVDSKRDSFTQFEINFPI
jgi:signal transduction histidine kinase